MSHPGRGGARPDPPPGDWQRSSSNNRGPWVSEQAVAMDRRYRFGRYLYDVASRFSLLGRDKLLDRIVTGPSSDTLEVGCGTARNLIRLASRRDQGRLYGLDASHVMLASAERSIRRALGRCPAGNGIVLRQGLAEELDARRMFGHERRFDTIFFAYSLSMMPPWQRALGAALANLRPGGVILVVDVWDRRDLPAVLASGLAGWLARQGVVHRPEILAAIESLGGSGRADVRVEAVARRYAYLATIRTPAT